MAVGMVAMQDKVRMRNNISEGVVMALRLLSTERCYDGCGGSTNKHPLICKTVSKAVEPGRNESCSPTNLKGDEILHK